MAALLSMYCCGHWDLLSQWLKDIRVNSIRRWESLARRGAVPHKRSQRTSDQEKSQIPRKEMPQRSIGGGLGESTIIQFDLLSSRSEFCLHCLCSSKSFIQLSPCTSCAVYLLKMSSIPSLVCLSTYMLCVKAHFFPSSCEGGSWKDRKYIRSDI